MKQKDDEVREHPGFGHGGEADDDAWAQWYEYCLLMIEGEEERVDHDELSDVPPRRPLRDAEFAEALDG